MNGITITVDAKTAEAAAKLQAFFKNAVGGVDRLVGAGQLLSGLGSKIAAAFTIGALVNFERHAINVADELNKLSQRTGVAVDLLDALRRQGEIADLSFGELANGLGLLNDRIYTAATRGGEAAQVFRDLRVDLLSVNGSLRPTEAILLDIAQAFSRLPDGQQKTAAAMDLFSRAGRSWIPLLNEGAEGMERLRKQGGGITPQMATNAEEFNDSLTELKHTMEEVFISVGQRLLPALQQMVNFFKELSTRSDATSISAQGLTDTFKGLTTVVLVAAEGFNILGRLIGVGVFLSLQVLNEEVQLIMRTFRSLLDSIKTIEEALIDLAKTSVDSLGVVRKAVTGDLKGALDQFQSLANRAADDWGKIFATFPDHLRKSWTDASDTAGRIFESIKSVADQNLFDIGLEVMRVGELIKSLFTPKAANLPKAAGTPSDNKAPVVSDEARKVADIQLETDKARLAVRRQMIEADPLKGDLEKSKELLPILNEQLNLTQRIIEVKFAESKDPNLSPEARAKAERDMVDIQAQQLDLLRQRQQLAGADSFGFQFRSAFKAIEDEGGNLAKLSADAFKDIWDNALNSISNGITDLITGAKTLGQAFREIGVSILQNVVSSIVQVGVKWIATRVLMATVGKAIQAASLASLAPLAAAQTAMWVVPATLATIASYGGAAAAAPPLIAASEAAVGFQSIPAFREGGRPEVGRPALIGEDGPEIFVPDRPGTIYTASQTRSIMSNGGNVLSTNGDAGRPIVNNKVIVVADIRQAALEAMNSPAGERITIQHIDGRRLDLGMNT